MNTTNFCALRFYMHENRKLNGILLYQWLLEEAKRQGVGGGSAFRAIAGYGRHGVMHEQSFFELGGDQTVVVELLLDEQHAQAMLERLRTRQISIGYSRHPIEFGIIEGKT